MGQSVFPCLSDSQTVPQVLPVVTTPRDMWSMSASRVLLLLPMVAPHGYHKFRTLPSNTADVVLTPGGDSGVSGNLTITQNTFPIPHVRINGYISGLTPGFHGFHVHMTGDLGNNLRQQGDILILIWLSTVLGVVS